ncbi:MAG: asparagine synthetase B family protein [Casimicrobiaceae bacterium]
MTGWAHVQLTAPGWAVCGGTRVRGQAHIDDRFHSASELASRFAACVEDERWERLLKRCNGSFAIVSERGSAILAAVDRIRSIPLFYRSTSSLLRVGDSAERVLADGSDVVSNASADVEFQLTGYVTGAETLVRDLYQIQAGELLRWDAERPLVPVRHRYYTFEHGDYFTTSVDDLVARLEILHDRVFRRLVDSVEGRQIVVPLSGGHDSRLIATALRDLGVHDVVCYTYGLPDNWEAKISRELALHLGFRWEFVPYAPEKWRAWSATARFAQYFREAGNLASVPHVQDWPAVLELMREGKVAADAIFAPGHSGDFLAGSHIPKQFASAVMVRRREFLDALLRTHYSLWDWPRGSRATLQEEFTRRIEATIGRVGDVSSPRAADLFELWDLRERQAKFIGNSVRVYEHFGHEWRLPLFDHELMDFWARIPLPLRVGRKLYYEFAGARQQAPVTPANTDRNAMMRGVLGGITAAGLKPLAKRMRRMYRAWRWREEYTTSELGWLAMVDPGFFEHTYTGKEIAHSYVALAYRDWALSAADGALPRRVIPALAMDCASDSAHVA